MCKWGGRGFQNVKGPLSRLKSFWNFILRTMGKVWRVSSVGVTSSDLSFRKNAPFLSLIPFVTRLDHKHFPPGVLQPVSLPHSFSSQKHAPNCNQTNRAKPTKKPLEIWGSHSCFKSSNDFPMPLGYNPNPLTGVPRFRFPVYLSSLFSHHFPSHTLQVYSVSFSYSNEPCSLAQTFLFSMPGHQSCPAPFGRWIQASLL